MNRELRSLYDKCLKDKWLPLLEEWKKSHDLDLLRCMGIGHHCTFCYECNNRCHNCKINPVICNSGGLGYYGQYSIRCNSTGTYLKKMIRLLKQEKFKCLFKRSG